MSSRSTDLVDAIIAEEIARSFEATEPGHCVRIDFFELPQIEPICAALQERAPGLAIHYLGNQQHPLAITTDRAIELRNRKQVRLCLFIPADLVDAAFSSLANSFAPLDGRELLRIALQRVRKELSPAVRAIVNDVLHHLRPPLRASESQKIAFCRDVSALEARKRLDEAGSMLWRVGLITDRGADFRTRLDRNRSCVIKLAMPLKLQASLVERITSTNVDAATRVQLTHFFRDRAMNDYAAWSQALAEGHGPTFEQWTFPAEERSDLRHVRLQSFVDRQGRATNHSKLKQPDGPGGALIAEYGEQAKGIGVKWVTDPLKAKNIGGWRVEIVPVANPDAHDLDLPSRDLPANKASVTLKIELEAGDEESLADESFQVRLSALDQRGDLLQSAEDGSDLIALSEEFFIAKAEEVVGQGSKRELRPQTVTNLALARLEVAGKTKANQLEEQEPLWTSTDLDYFSVRLDERHKVMLGMSRLLKELEERSLSEPLSWGRYSLRLDEIEEATRAQIQLLDPPARTAAAWTKFRRLREQLFKQFMADKPRHLVAVATWDHERVRQVERYAHAYSELLKSLASNPELQDELMVALSIDTLLIVTPRRGGGVEEALVTLPTHPLRMLWYGAYQQLLAQWESNLLQLRPQERQVALDLDPLRQITPANMPAFVTHPMVARPLLHSANLRFFYGLALPPTLDDPQRRLEDLAIILGDRYGLEQQSDPSTIQLTAHIQRFRELHPYLRDLSITQVNADRGDLLTESIARLFPLPTAKEDEDVEANEIPKLTIHTYVAAEQTGTTQDISELRRLVRDHGRSNGHAYLTPALSYGQRPLEVLKRELPPAAHLAIASDLMQPEAVALSHSEREELGSSFSFYGLLCRLLPTFAPQGEHLCWQQRLVGSGVRADRHPVDEVFTNTLVATQIQIAQAGCRTIGGRDEQRLGLRIDCSPYQQQLLEQLHQQSGWVITIDRFFALDYYDSPYELPLQHLARKYLIDYSPEFTDGIAHRFVVTTIWRDEVEEVLSRAMDELGFLQLEQSVGSVLDALKMVSGQLALHASERHQNATAAVGLGMVILHLQQHERLRNAILVPMDVGAEIFQQALPGQQHRERHCDLALFSFKRSGSVEVTFIEVKWRRGTIPFESLASDMLIQMQSSAALLRKRFFAEPDRIDGVLQRARLANLLRFYLERAQRHDLIAPEHGATILEHLGRLERQEVTFRPSYEGYIITPDATHDHTIALPEGATILVRSIATLATGFVVAGSRPEPTELPPGPGGVSVPPAPLAAGARLAPVEPTPTPVVAVANEATTVRAEADNLLAEPVPPLPPSPPDMIRVQLGTTDEQPIVWSPSVKGSPHLFIIGIPGQGKSVAMGHLLTDLVRQRVAPLVFDFHGQFADPNGPLVRDYGIQTLDAADGLPFNPLEVMVRNGKLDWRTNSQEVAELFTHVAELGGVQQDGIYQAILDAYKAKGFHAQLGTEDIPELPTPGDLIQFIEQREAKGKVKNLAARCRSLLEMDLFKPTLTPLNLREALRSGMVIDLHALHSERVQLAAGAFIIHKLYREMFLWGEADRIRLVLILDEAHRLAKDKTLPKLMKEGRKYGIAVVVASQGMKDFHADVLGNAGTKVLFRINYPESRTLVKYLAPPPKKQLDKIVEQLPVGQAFVQTPEMRFGRQVRMRPPAAPGES